MAIEQERIDKARRFLAAASLALAANDSETAISRSYYAVYHAIKSALPGANAIKSHVGLIARCAQWNQRYTRLNEAGTLPKAKDLRASLLALYRWREDADYEVSADFPSRAAQAVAFASRFIQTIQEGMQ